MVLIPLVNWRLLAFDEPAEVVSQEEDGHLYEDLSQQTAQPIAKLKDGTTIVDVSMLPRRDTAVASDDDPSEEGG